MEFAEAFKTMQGSDAFASWRGSHPSAFLSHAFVMIDKENDPVWQFGYYDDDAKKVTTFVLDTGVVSVIPEEDIIGKDMSVMPLAVEKVTTRFADALNAADKARHQHYPHELKIKTFFILQMREGIPVFSVTFLTQSFKTVNVKISADDCSVVEHSLAALMDFA